MNAWSPSTSPEPASDLILENVSTQTEVALKKLKQELWVDDAKTANEQKEFEEVKKFFEENKDKIKKITHAELTQLKEAIIDTKEEKNKDQEELEGTLEVTADGAIDFKENVASTPPSSPAETPSAPAENTATAIASTDQRILELGNNIPEIPEFKNPKKMSWLKEWIINSIGTTGILGAIRKFLMWYETAEEMTDTMTAMKNIMSIRKSSQINSLINMSQITEYDFRDILRNNNHLDFTNMRNVEAAFLWKHSEDARLAPYHNIYFGIEDMAHKTDIDNDNSVVRFEKLLEYSKWTDLVQAYGTRPEADLPVAPTPVEPQAPTEEEKQAERIAEIKTAQEADENLKKTQEEVEKAKALPDSAEKKAKVDEAETKLKTAETTVNAIVETSKTKIAEMLKKSEDELKDTELTIDQKTSQKKTLESQLTKDPTNKTIRAELDTVNWELKNLGTKKKTLEDTLVKIKAEQEKFPKDTTTKISATEAQKASQEAERLALEGAGVVEVEQTKEEKENQTKAFEKELGELTEEIKNTLHDKNENFSEIDNPEDILNLQKKIDSFFEGKNSELLKEYEIPITQIKSEIEFAQGKIDLIKLWKKKEAEWGAQGQKINYWAWTYGIWDGFVEIDGTDIDVDIAWDTDDNVLMKTNVEPGSDLITKLWGKASTVLKIIRENEKKLTGTEGFKSKKGKVFSINIDK